MYDLLDEGWIPTDRGPVGLLDLFRRSKELGYVSCDPLQATAIYRLSLAILHDSIGAPPDVVKWDRNIREGIDVEAVVEYLLERRGKFDLRGDMPFLQTGAEAGMVSDEELRSPWVLDYCQDNGSLLFNKHPVDSNEKMDPDFSIRALLSYNSFSSACGNSRGGYTSRGPLGKSVCCLLIGETVSETLALNLFPADKVPNDRPVWETRDFGNGLRSVPKGPCEALVWPSRRIRFVWEADKVSKIDLMQGKGLGDSFFDQMSFQVAGHGKREGKGVPFEYRFQDVWRVLPLAFGDKYGFAAGTSLKKCIGKVGVRKRLMLSFVGMAQEKSKVNAYGKREAEFSTDVLSPDNFSKYCMAVEYAEEVGGSLRYLPVAEIPEKERRDSSRVEIAKKRGARLEESYWWYLGPVGNRLSNLQISDAEWKKEVMAAADKVLSEYEHVTTVSVQSLRERARTQIAWEAYRGRKDDRKKRKA